MKQKVAGSPNQLIAGRMGNILATVSLRWIFGLILSHFSAFVCSKHGFLSRRWTVNVLSKSIFFRYCSFLVSLLQPVRLRLRHFLPEWYIKAEKVAPIFTFQSPQVSGFLFFCSKEIYRRIIFRICMKIRSRTAYVWRNCKYCEWKYSLNC